MTSASIASLFCIGHLNEIYCWSLGVVEDTYDDASGFPRICIKISSSSPLASGVPYVRPVFKLMVTMDDVLSTPSAVVVRTVEHPLELSSSVSSCIELLLSEWGVVGDTGMDEDLFLS